MFKFKDTKRLLSKTGINLFSDNAHLNADDVKLARQYINDYWPKLERFHPKHDETLLGLPYPYLVPAYEKGHEFDFNELYYWDCYFMIQGLLDEEHKDLVIGILEDLLSLLDQLGMIPNASRLYLTGHSQPPFLTSLIFDIYETYRMDNDWLTSHMAKANKEYMNVWMGKEKPHARQVYQGLSRWYDINYIHDLAEAESGWDMNTRFSRKALDYVAVDLNSLLYKYEMDFARTDDIIGNKARALEWEQIARLRMLKMDETMWDKSRGMYYDFNYKKERQGNVNSLASYYPMWAGLATDEQARRLVKNLAKFENKGGLATTDSMPLGQFALGSMPTQWAYPNGWAPLHFLVVKGLQRYGYQQDARRIAMKWLRTNLDWFNKNHLFLEKYNVVAPDKPPAKGLYPSQTGFGWTNAVFERFCKEFIDNA
jgi:alpha,alpha-trehalase